MRSVNIIHGLSGRPAQLKEGIIPASRSPWSVGIRGAIHNSRYTNRLTFRCAIMPIIERRTDPLAARSGVTQVRITVVT